MSFPLCYTISNFLKMVVKWGFKFKELCGDSEFEPGQDCQSSSTGLETYYQKMTFFKAVI